jgi:PKD repeat protein
VSHLIHVNFQHRNDWRAHPVYSLQSVSPFLAVDVDGEEMGMRASRWATKRVSMAVVAALAAAVPALAATPASAASPGYSDGGVVANAVPAKFTPNIGDGAVESMVQVGNLMVVGGSFTTVTPTAGAGAGTAVTRNYLFAFDATTGALSTTFVPAVNGEVDAIVPTADGTGVYVGGKFTTADGVTTRLAEFSLATGARVTTFSPSLNGLINDMALVGNRLFIGGTFTTVKSQIHDGLASVNAATGAIDPYLTIQLTGHHNYGRVAGSAEAAVGATSIAVSPDQTRMIVDGNFISAQDGVATYARDQIISVNLGATSATVDANWNTNAFTNACYSWAYDSFVRGVGWSPDGSYFVVVATGGYYNSSFQDCDAASRFNASSTGQAVTPAWVDYTGTDSMYSVAVTSSAVYVGGHFRWLNNPYGQDNAKAGAVPRPGLAALDPANGVPMSWNPGRNPRGHGAEAIYVTKAGVWVGSDTDYVGNYQYKRQKLDFFPYAGGSAVTGNDAGDAHTVFTAGSLAGANTFTANTFDPSTGAGSPAATQPSTGGGIAWGSITGAFVLNGRIWYASGGQFFYRTWDGGNGFGPAQLVDPYDDPYWDSVQTGSGQAYQGGLTSFYAELPKVTGMFYANRSIYYTLSGSKNLYSRAFAPDTVGSSVANQVTGGVISPVEVTVVSGGNPVDFSNASGMFLAGGSLWYATKSDGKLHQAPWNGTTVSGASTVDTLATGNWAARGVFLDTVAPPVPPVAAFTSSCLNATCFFDASASTAPGSSIASYAWDFGDSGTGTGATPQHAYSGPGTYQVTLTVTNARGDTNAITQPVTVSATQTQTIAFVASAANNSNGTTDAVTVPASVSAGDGLLLIATGVGTGPLTAPAGWTQVGAASAVSGTNTALTTTTWERVATAADAGSSVSVSFPGAVHSTVQLLAYSGTNATNPVVAFASKATVVSASSYTTPTIAVPANGDVVVSVWSGKSSAITAWTTPAGQTVQSIDNGSGSGRINSVATDGGVAGAGPAGGLTATTDQTGSAFGAWTIVLGP